MNDSVWQWNYYSSTTELAGKVVEVLEDQSRSGQVLKLSREGAIIRYPDFMVASLRAVRKDEPNGVVTARVLLDGTNGCTRRRRHLNRMLQKQSHLGGDRVEPKTPGVTKGSGTCLALTEQQGAPKNSCDSIGRNLGPSFFLEGPYGDRLLCQQ